MGKNFLVQPWTGILHAEVYLVWLRLPGSDEHLSSIVTNAARRLECIDNEVEDDLLDLNPISCNRRQILRELRLQRDPVLQCFTAGKLDHLTRGLIYVHAVSRCRRFQHERTHTIYDSAGPIGVLQRTGERGPDLLKIRGVLCRKFIAALRRLRTAAMG